MGNDELRRFAVIYNYWDGTVEHLKKMQKLIKRFGPDKVERALQKRENKFNKDGSIDPLYEKWERDRQFA